MQRSTSFLILLALGVGFVLFKVKYEVVEIEQKLSKTLVQIKREKENIHILKAEWSHLNEPQRLQSLAKKYLDIGPIKTTQMVAMADPMITFASHLSENEANSKGQTHLASKKEIE